MNEPPELAKWHFYGGTINDVGPSHPHIQWVPDDLSSGIKGRGWSWPLISFQSPSLEWVEPYLHSSIWLHSANRKKIYLSLQMTNKILLLSE